MRLRELLHQPAERALAVGVADRAERAVQARREVLQVAVVREHPVAAPQLAHERVRVLERDAALRRLADVGDDVARCGSGSAAPSRPPARCARCARRRTAARRAPSKKAMPKPSLCSSARVAKPVKLNITSVGVLAFMPSSWHIARLRRDCDRGTARSEALAPADQVAGVAGLLRARRSCGAACAGSCCARQISRSASHGWRVDAVGALVEVEARLQRGAGRAS